MKHKRNRTRKYRTVTAMTIHDDSGDVVVERCEETGELTFLCPATITGEKLTVIKRKNEEKINLFRQGGGQSETH